MEANTAEDIIWILCVVTMIGGALFLDENGKSALAKWSRQLGGRYWWIWFPVVILIEIVLNMLGFSIMPWRW